MTREQRLTQFQGELKRFLVVVDFEATCCDDNSFPRDEMEIIEVGAVVLDREKNWEEHTRYEYMINPVIHPELTPFCKTLTGITQQQVDGGYSYADILGLQHEKLGRLGDDWSWCSWGAFDKNIAVKNGEIHGLSPLFDPDLHFNMKVWYSSLSMTKQGYGLDRAVNKEGLRFIGQHHRAMADAENVAQIFRKVLGVT